MGKLLILPGACDALGGTLITLSLLIKGFEQYGLKEEFCILVHAGSIMEKYLRDTGQSNNLKLIPARNKGEFLTQALQWVNRQPLDYPLLLDNCLERALLPSLLIASPKLRLSGRRVYHFCHDLGLSHNHLGELLRKLTLKCLSPKAICNSQFTAESIRRRLISDIQGVLYQPVDTERFNNRVDNIPPAALQPILKSGAKLILTPSRINKPKIINDKNLRTLIPVLASLKANGYFYHSVVIGEDKSPGKIYTQELLQLAKNADVADRFSILPPTFAIEDYYKHSSVVLTLAPREPFGRTVIEALACGVPLIGSNTGGIGEILSNFAPEWMVDPEDPKAVAEAIVRVSNDASTDQILEKAKDWVYSECSLTSYAKKMMEITGIALPSSSQKESVKAS